MNKPLKIAVIAPYQVYPAQMGGQKCIASFYQYISSQVPVTIISTDQNENPPQGNVEVVRALGKSFLRYLNPFLFFKTKSIIVKGAYSHLVVEHPYFGWLGYLHKKFTGLKLVIHSHNIESMRFKSTGRWWWRILWHYERFVHQSADHNFFITDEDRTWAETHYQLTPSKCFTITYGTSLQATPSENDRSAAASYLRSTHGIAPGETILLFNGTLNYQPNLDAVKVLLDVIIPALRAVPSFKFKLVICGKGLPPSFNDLKNYDDKDVIYAGFVKDIVPYFLGSNIFLNPVIEGGGIKTKLVEALAYNLHCISTASGAIGISQEKTGRKLTVVNDGDWATFTESIIHADVDTQLPGDFFKEFYWGNIASKAIEILKQ